MTRTTFRLGVFGLILALGIGVPEAVTYGWTQHIDGNFITTVATGTPSSATIYPNGDVNVTCNPSLVTCCDAGSGGANIYWPLIPINAGPDSAVVELTIQD